MSFLWLAATSFLFLVPSTVLARTWHILNDGSGDAATIQAGIDSAFVGDTVLVGSGTYLENLTILDKNFVLKSQNGPEDTILDGSGRQDAVLYLSGQTNGMVVSGFTITRGVGRNVAGVIGGGGLMLDNGASPVILGNKIAQNGLAGITRFGGGILVRTFNTPASPIIKANEVDGNTADLGGGISLGNGSPTVLSNVFRENNCRLDGGAVYAVLGGGSLLLENNQFWDNFAGDHGGGIDVYGNNLTAVQINWNLFVGNSAEGIGAGDTGAGGAIHISDVSGSIANNTMVDGDVPNESACSGGGISLESTSPNLDISRNIIAMNRDCGIACRFRIQNSLGPNLFWMNENSDLGLGMGSSCPSGWSANQIFADPMFCGPGVRNYTVSIASPALTGPVPMGVWNTPGCGSGVSVRQTTWGILKARY